MTKQEIIIDTDPGVDDMLAILLLLAAPTIDVHAITTVAGNTTIQNVTNNANYILQLASSDTPLFSGATAPLQRTLSVASVHGVSGLDGVNVSEKMELNGLAVDKILEIIRSNPREVGVLILGPQTNIARAILSEPETMKLAKQLVIMGGAFNVPGNKNIVAEFNIAVDPEAAAIVADFPVQKTYIPLDVCNRIQVPIGEFERIKNERIRQTIIAALTPYIQRINSEELETRGALMYDVLAAYFLLKPEICKTKKVKLFVETKGEFTYGMTLTRKTSSKNMSACNASIVTDIPYATFIDDFFNEINTTTP